MKPVAGAVFSTVKKSHRVGRHRRVPLAIAVAAAAASSLLLAPASRGADTWVGNSSVNWSDLNNWNPAAQPSSGDSLIFDVAGTAGLNLTDDLMTPGGYNVAGITFTSNAGPYVINPASSPTNGFTLTGGITNNGTSLQTINETVAMYGAQSITTNAGGGDITLGGPITDAGVAGSLTVAGTGTLTLSGPNTYSGGTTVTSGTLVAANAQALGSPSGSLAISDGATLNVKAPANMGLAWALFSIGQGDQNTYAGPLSGIQSGLATSSPTSVTNVTSLGSLPFGTANDVQAIGSGMINIAVGGSYTFYRGGATDDDAAIFIDGQAVVPGVPTSAGNPWGVTGSGTITLSPGEHNIVVGWYQGFGGEGLQVQWSGPDTGNNQVDLSTASANLTPDLYVPNLNGAGNLALTTGNLIVGFDNSNSSYGGIISGIGGVNKWGSGTLTLSGTNTYTGATNIVSGTLLLGNDSAMGSSAQPVTVSGGTLDLGGFSPSVNGLSDGGSSNGTVTSSSGAPTLTIVTTNNSSYSGAITGSLAVNITGSGTQTFSGNNNYSGGTTVTSGTLVAAGAGAIPSTGGTLTVSTGSTLSVNAPAHTGLAWAYYGSGNTPGSQTTLAGPLSGVQSAVATTIPTSVTNVTSVGNLPFGTGGNVQAIGSGMINIATAGTYTFQANADDDSAVYIDGQAVVPGVPPAAGNPWGVTTSDSVYLSAGEHNIVIPWYQGFGGESLNIQWSGPDTGNNLVNLDTNSANLTPDLYVPNINGGGNLALNTGNLIVGFDNSDSNFSGTISGIVGVNKWGGGTLTLSGSNTYTGVTNITTGTLNLGHINAVQNSTVNISGTTGGALTFAGGITSPVLGGLTGNGNVTLNTTLFEAVTLNVGNNNASTVYTGSLSGDGGLTKIGMGTLTLTSAQSYGGATVISNGTLQLSGGVPAGTVGYYTFSNSNNLGADASGNGNTLTTGAGAPTWVAGGKFGKGALSLNGGSSLVAASGGGINGLPIGNSPYTVAAWINLNDSGNDGIVGWGNYGNSGQVNAFRTAGPNGILNYWWANDLQGNTPNMLNNWHYVAVTWDPGLNSRTLYFDGSVVNSDTPGVEASTANNFAVGVTNGGEFFNGQIDNLLIAGTALSSTQLQSLMNNGSVDVLPTATALQIASGATLDLNGLQQNVGSLANSGIGGGTVTNSSTSPAVLIVGNDNTNQTFSGTINDGSGGVSLTKVGVGTQTLSSSNTYTGATTITGGALNLGHNLAVQDSTVTVATGTLTFNTGITNPLLGGLAGSGNVALDTATSQPVTLRVGNNNSNTTYSGALGGDGGLTKLGSGTLTLTGSNTYGGTTLISSGTLQVLGGVIAPGTLAHRWSFNNSLSDSVGGSDATIYGSTIVGANSVTINGNGSVHTSYVSLGSNILPTSNAPATIELWATENQVQSWSRIFDFGSTAGAPSNLLWSWTQGTNNPSVISPNGGNQNAASFNTGQEYHIALVITPTGTNTTNLNWYQMDTSGNVLSSGSFASGWDLSQLTQTNMWLGRSEYGDQDAGAGYDEVRIWDTALTQAQLQTLGQEGPDVYFGTGSNVLPIASPVVIASAATLDLDGTAQQVASISDLGAHGGSIINSAGNIPATLTLSNPNAVSTTFSGTIGDNGAANAISLVITGIGTQVLAGSNTFSGSTTVSSGTLVVGHNMALQNSTVVPNGGAVNFATGITSPVFGGLAGSGNMTLTTDSNEPVNLNAGNNNSNTTYSGVLDGNGGLTKIGAGTLAISTAQAYTGATTISSGTLQLVSGINAPGVLAHRWSFNNSLNDSVGSSNATVFGSTTLGANAVTINGNGSVNTSYVSLGTNILPTSNSPATIEVWATENQVQSWSRIFDFGSTPGGVSNLLWSWTQGTGNPSVLYTGDTNRNAATFNTGTEYHIALVFAPNGSNTDVNWYQLDTVGDVLASGNFTANWNVSQLTQTNMWLGRSEYGDQDATAGYDEVRIWNTALTQSQLVNLDLQGPDVNFGGSSDILPTTTALAISPSGTLDLNGTSQQVVSVADGVGGGGAIINSAAYTPVTLTINTADATTTTFSGTISDTGPAGAVSLVITGNGTQVLAGSNTYTGSTTISGGTLNLTGTIGGGVNGGTAITSSATFNESNTGNIAGSSSLTITDGTTTLNNANTFTGPTAVNGGTLVVGHNQALQNSTVTAGAGTINFATGITAPVFGGLAGSGNVTLTTATAEPVILMAGNNGASTSYTGVLSGSGGLTKVGAGTLSIGAAQNYTGATTVSAGTLQLVSGGQAPGVLAHRWSFNNSLNDSVGGSTAGIFGNTSLGANQVTISGNGSVHTSYVSLGTNILPTSNSPATIELWATENQLQSWSRIFDFGSTAGAPSNLLWSWTQGTNNPSVISPNGANQNAASFNTGTEYHVALVITPNGNNTNLNWYQLDTTGNVLSSGNFVANWNLSQLTQTNMWLGRSEYGDQDAGAGYDEVRIWDTALTQSQLVASDIAGPDASFAGGSSVLPTTTALSVAAGATLDLNGTNQQVASLSDGVGGGGSIINGATYTPASITISSPTSVTTSYSGTITDNGSGNPVSLMMAGNGAQILTGSNTYSGGTKVTGGTLLVNNTAGSGTGSGAVVVTGGRLGGTGTIGGSVTISGGTISPGADPANSLAGTGTLATTGNQTWSSGTYVWKTSMNSGWSLVASTAGAPGSNQDFLTIGGTLDIEPGFILDIAHPPPPFQPATSSQFIIANASSVTTNNGVTVLGNGQDLSGDFVIEDNGQQIYGDMVTVVQDGSGFDIEVTVTPEPGSLGLIGVAALGILRRKRRRI